MNSLQDRGVQVDLSLEGVVGEVEGVQLHQHHVHGKVELKEIEKV